jgi:hypothetical protein
MRLLQTELPVRYRGAWFDFASILKQFRGEFRSEEPGPTHALGELPDSLKIL